MASRDHNEEQHSGPVAVAVADAAASRVMAEGLRQLKEDVMRVLVAGATGAIGRPLVAALKAHGHDVAALTRDPNNADLLSKLGAQPLVADVLDRDGTTAAILDVRSEVVVDQLTALPRR